MAILTEGRHAAEFIVSEANGNRSRDAGILAKSNTLEAGAVLAKPTDGANKGKFIPLAKTGSNGEDVAVAILYMSADTTDAEATVTVIARGAEVDGGALSYASGADISGLADAGVIVR